MKLLFCTTCHDVFRMTLKYRECKCGKVFGAYNADGDTVTVSPDSVIVGVYNTFWTSLISNPIGKQEATIFNYDIYSPKVYMTPNKDLIGE